MFNRKYWRLGFLLFFTSLLFLLNLTRLFQIQVLDHQKYTVLAESQHGISYSLPAIRGSIYTQDGFPLVSNQPSYLLFFEPSQADFSRIGIERLAEGLLDILAGENNCPVINFPAPKGLDSYRFREACENELQRRLSFDRAWIPLIREVSLGQKERVEGLDFPGVGFELGSARFYPEGKLAAHVLGFVGSDGEGNPQGYYGLEGYYNGDLRGQEGLILEERSALGEPILVGDYRKRPSRQGRDLVLTLDRAVQFIVEKRLKEGVEGFGAESGTVIVMEPTTGAILAMANWPNYNPADPAGSVESVGLSESGELVNNVDEGTAGGSADGEGVDEGNRIERRNLGIASAYEPGSVAKAITMAAAIDSGEVTPQTTFYSQPLTIGSYTIRTWDNKYYGEETMIEVLEHSDNTGAAWVALERLGKRKLRDYFFKFGWGEKSGIDLEGEAEGIVKPLVQWRSIDLANASFGQGVSVTPLQLTQAFSIFANEGILARPFLVSELRDGDRVISTVPRERKRVISEHAAEIMMAMLTKAATHGEAQFFVLKDWEVAGKTGTAQIPVGGKYDPYKTNVTFVGFLPQSRKFVMLVKLEKPQSSIYAAETAVPLWMDIAKDLIAYYGIPPDK